MRNQLRSLAAAAAGALLVPAASAQYSTDFESVTADVAGTILTGQDGYYIPAGTTSVDFLAFTYAGNALGVAPNPTGGNQFVGVTGPAGGAFGRAQRDFAYAGGLMTIGYDIHASFLGALPSAQNVGSVSIQPFPGSQSFIALAVWTDPATAATWDVNYIWFDASGAQIQEVIPDPAFQNLPVGAWYRWETDFDLTSNSICATRITDLQTGATAEYRPSGRYLLGGAAGSVAPTGYRLFSGGGVAGNTLVFDNVEIGPKYAPPDIIHYTFDNGDATNSATGSVGDGIPGATTEFTGGELCAGAAAPACGVTASGAGSQINTGWTTTLGGSDWTVGMFADRRNATALPTALQYAFGNSTAGSFRCFVGGVAGTTGFLLRGPVPDTNIPDGGSLTEKVHVVWCHDSAASEVRGYLNGQLAVTVPLTTPLNINGTGNLSLMGYTTSSVSPGFVIDDFRFYGRCLGEAEINYWYARGDHALGAVFCDPATANSTGVPGALAASGSSLVELNTFRLHANDLPLNSFGMFITSLSTDLVPMAGGGVGTLCLSNIGRGVGGAIVSSGMTGAADVTADLTMQPTSTGFAAVLPCETWHFQYWYRDAIGGAATSNLTNAISVVFE